MTKKKLISINCWRYWESKENAHLTGYYPGFFNIDNEIVLVAEGAGEDFKDDNGTQVQGDVFLTFKCADDTVTDISVDKDSWNKISQYYEIEF